MSVDYQFPCVSDRVSRAEGVYIAPQALVCGAVELAADVSVWPMTVIRGDKGLIRIGAGCNIQDGSILHADPDAWLTIGTGVSIGHGAIVHGCTVGDDVLIGMGAVILNHAQIGRGSLIGARALVTEGMIVPPHSLVLGIPGKIRPLDDAHLERIRRTAENYIALKNAYLAAAQG
ncbi:MAG: gamma carbonic anhydrase family protein [Chloroflexi bacterium]|nr:gamma carbonic anhydrase family protein [Chloroflexota bacterium]